MADARRTPASGSRSISCRCSGARRLTSADRLVPVAHHDDRAVRLPARPGDGGARQGGAAPAVTAAATASANAAIVGDQDGLRRLVVLGLGQQIDRDVARIVRRIGEHDDLGRAGDGIDADAAEHLPLGLGDIGVAGADDAIDRRDAWRCRRPAPRSPGRRRRDRSRPRRRGARRPAPAGSARHPGVGTHIAMRATPATRAGIAFISTEDG